MCKKTIRHHISETWVKTRICVGCRHKLIPDYIPAEQHLQYLILLNRKINDRQKKFTKRN